jgi:hypothetical protein
VVIDGITPQPGFSVVGVKASNGALHGIQETVSEKESVTGEISGAGAKISSGLETTHSVQESTLISIGTERSLARVEQYLIARKTGNRGPGVPWLASDLSMRAALNTLPICSCRKVYERSSSGLKRRLTGHTLAPFQQTFRKRWFFHALSYCPANPKLSLSHWVGCSSGMFVTNARTTFVESRSAPGD